MTHYDVVLILSYFRSATAYLPIIKYLSSKYRIGLLTIDLDGKSVAKNQVAHERFVAECVKLGAKKLGEDTATSAVLIVQQWPYAEDVAASVMRRVRANRRIGLMALSTAGLQDHDAFLRQFGIDKVYVPNRRFMEFLLDRRGARDTYRDVEIEQVGLPFKKYPIFPEFSADYLIASPTAFSFLTEADKHLYLEAVLSLLNQTDDGASIAYKAHNGSSRDYFTPAGYTVMGEILSRIPGSRNVVRMLLRLGIPAAARIHLERLYTGLLHASVLRRVTPLSQVTANAEFALEAFLPGVRKGVIGGLSNTIWGTLYFGLPFYNCVDATERDPRARNQWLGKSSKELLDLNLAFFGVPYCAGDLSRGARGEEIVAAADRQGDLIEALATDLNAVTAQRDRQTA